MGWPFDRITDESPATGPPASGLAAVVQAPDTVTMTLPQALTAWRRGEIEMPTDGPSTLTGLMGDAIPVRKIPQPPRRPAWKDYLDTQTTEVKAQQAIVRNEMQAVIARKRSEAAVFNPAEADMRRQYEKTKRLDDAARQLMENTDA
jgi:hypothetical protein